MLGTQTPSFSKLQELYAQWRVLADMHVDVDDDGAPFIEMHFLHFLHFQIGTPVMSIWAWFETQHPCFKVGDVQRGIFLTQ